jgi:hypothetical protein
MGQLFAWGALGRGFLSWESMGAAASCALQEASHFLEAIYRRSHAVLPASFAHRGTEVQWIPLWELMGGMHPEQESGSPVDIGQGLHKCACDVSVSF